MFWDDLIRRWRREQPMTSPRLLRGAAGAVAALPGPRPQRRRRWNVVLALVLLAAALYLVAGHSTPAPSATAVPGATQSIGS